MTDGASRLLQKAKEGLPPSHPFHDVFSRLTARENNWTSGQWMTERSGGSDVQNSETWATFAPLKNKTGEFGALDEGDYLVSGFKFFSSATDANVAVLLAKTDTGKISVFLAPLVKRDIDDRGNSRIVTNGARIHRLKVKLGTKQLPTAELELRDMRAHLIGSVDRGIATISTLLNITRVHTFTGTTAGLGRCLTIAKAFAKARTTRGQPLWKTPLHLRTLADVELKRRALVHLSQFTASLLGFVENGYPTTIPPGLVCLPIEGQEAEIVLRALTATAKAVCSKVAVIGAQECMEAMGGVGYIDDPDDSEHNIARAFRDLNVNTIWEGTTNVMSSELLRFILAKDNFDFLNRWITRNIDDILDERHKLALQQTWRPLRKKFALGRTNVENALSDGRRFIFSLAWCLCGTLLIRDAERDGDQIATEAADRWNLYGEGGVGEAVFHDVVRINAERDKILTTEMRCRLDIQMLYSDNITEDTGAKL